MKGTKALVLLSGGLDSMLAAKLLLEQGVEVTGICYESNFFNAGRARKTAKNLGVELKVVDIRKDELELVKNPPSGYGKNLNPCIDCHSLMIKKTGEIARAEKYDIIATGEVLGQRPFSQNARALEQVKKLSGVDVLRPLTAKNLPETEAEKSGLIVRGKLKDIKGRSREVQMRLAQKYKMTDYPSPAGGCLLTDSAFSERLNKMLSNWPECTVDDVELLKNGRVFWLKQEEGNPVLVVVARDKEESENLTKLAKKGDFMVELKVITGPVTLIRGLNTKDEHKIEEKYEIPEKLSSSQLEAGVILAKGKILDMVCILTGYYSTKARGREVDVVITDFT